MTKSISVFVPLYNHEKFIRATLTSALAQTLPPDEIVVIDDGSSDGSIEAAKSVLHPSIQIIAEQRNLGGPTTMRGLSFCKGNLVAILNSDDTWSPEKLKRQVDHLEKNQNCGVVFTLVSLIDEHGKTWKQATNRHQSLFQARNRDRHAWLRYFFHSGNVFCASSATVRRECFDRLGPLDGRYVQLQDLDMWLRIAMAGYDIHVVQDNLTYYRLARNGSNMSVGSPQNRAIYATEYARLLRNYWSVLSLDELLKIFPDISVSDDADDSLVLFYLAKYAAKQPTLHHRLFALETMQKWGGNLEAMRLAAKCHGFTHIEYRNFVAGWPIKETLVLGLLTKIEKIANQFLPYDFQQRIKTLILRINDRRHS
ncbi:glycosyltransferase family 2 protein [Afipia massiliensis]|uniref:Glycosyltransferase family 2 protein n=1 Tax=Afipia massiliensis TaxID=211460 RepID=A0A4U6BQS6_9BRAD|nr:glycosyltransferase family 2 protein [Afipia massiliensis]TKT72899.1 glycosyltransferase family 2 protein [Afipia massiliensis]